MSIYFVKFIIEFRVKRKKYNLIYFHMHFQNAMGMFRTNSLEQNSAIQWGIHFAFFFLHLLNPLSPHKFRL